MKVLLDNNLMCLGCTHKTVYTSKSIEFPPGVFQDKSIAHAARRSSISNDVEQYKTWLRNVVYLPGLTKLMNEGYVKPYRGGTLTLETMHQPLYRSVGKKGIFDYNLWGDYTGKCKQIEEHKHNKYRIEETMPDWAVGVNYSSKKYQNQWKYNLKIRRKHDRELNMLVSYLDEKHDQDIWHILSGERNEIDVFLSNDGKIAREIERRIGQNPSEKHRKANEYLRNMKIKIMGLEELGICLGIEPICCEKSLYEYVEAKEDFPLTPMVKDQCLLLS